MAKKIIIALVSLAIIGGGVFMYFYNSDSSDNNVSQDNQALQQETEKVSQDVQKNDEEKPEYDFTSAESIHVLVNKSNSLPIDYVPDLVLPDVPLNTSKSESELSVDKRIEDNVENLFNAAKKAGHNIMLASAYRSVELQRFYYNNYVEAYSQAEADKFSARPGHSEHQSGLAIDIAEIGDDICYLNQCFAASEPGQWLAENAYKFGFILRYPKDKSAITGYEFEPWHFRFVGKNVSSQIHENNLTYEEFYQNSLAE